MDTQDKNFSLTGPHPRRQHQAVVLLFQIIFLLGWTLLLGACKSATPEPTPTPTAAPPTPIWESSIQPTPTIPDSGLAVVDDGSPLPLRVVERYPAIGQELSLSGEVVLKFNQAVDSTKTVAAWKMTGPEGRDVPGRITWPDASTMKFKPNERLTIGTSYRVVLGEGAVSVEGIPLSEPLEMQFNTVGELQVSQTFPVDGTTEVSSQAVITAIFNRPVVPLVIAEERDQLPNPLEINPPVAGQGEWVNTSVFAFHPDRPLSGGTTYWVTIKAGLADAVQETQHPVF